jgi:hypothetical protein
MARSEDFLMSKEWREGLWCLLEVGLTALGLVCLGTVTTQAAFECFQRGYLHLAVLFTILAVYFWFVGIWFLNSIRNVLFPRRG